MRFKDRKVDTSGVDDLRGSSGRRAGPGMAMAEDGLVGLVVVLLVMFLGGGTLPQGLDVLQRLDGGVLGRKRDDLRERPCRAIFTE